VADDERRLAVVEPLEDPAEGLAEDARVRLDQLRVRRAQVLQPPASGLLVGLPPPILSFGAEARLDDRPAGDRIPERGCEAGERLRGALGAG